MFKDKHMNKTLEQRFKSYIKKYHLRNIPKIIHSWHNWILVRFPETNDIGLAHLHHHPDGYEMAWFNRGEWWQPEDTIRARCDWVSEAKVCNSKPPDKIIFLYQSLTSKLST